MRNDTPDGFGVSDVEDSGDVGLGGGLAALDRLRAMFGLSIPELAGLFQVSETVLHEWVRRGVPPDIVRVIAEYEKVGAELAVVLQDQPGTSVPQLARSPLDGLGGRSVLGALAAGEREAVRHVVGSMHRVR